MPLSLANRKSIRDNQQYLDAAVERIKGLLGVEWSIEIDIEGLLAVLTDDYSKNNPGECFYKEIATNIAECVANTVGNPVVKEALVEANTNNKIVLLKNDDKNNNKDWVYRFTNGTLELLFRSICNTSDIKYFKLENVIPLPGVYSLPARLNLNKNQEKFALSFEKIKAATGVEWSLDEASLESVYPHVGTYQNQVGDIFSEVIDYVAQNIEKRLSDEMVKEAFLELTPKAKLVFKFAEKLTTSNYWEYKFEDQSLTVYFKAIANTSDARDFDFEKLL